MHRERALTDAILVGTNTVIIDNPSLTTRLWPGTNPRPVTFFSPRLPEEAKIMERGVILLNKEKSLPEEMHRLYKEFGITSLMVEGGPKVLRSFLDSELADALRVEVSPQGNPTVSGNRIINARLDLKS